MRAVLAFATAAVAGLVISGMVWTAWRGEVYTSHFDGVMGTSLDIRIQARSEWAGQQAEQAILDEIDRESTILSSYDPASEFSRWRHAPGVATHFLDHATSLLPAAVAT